MPPWSGSFNLPTMPKTAVDHNLGHPCAQPLGRAVVTFADATGVCRVRTFVGSETQALQLFWVALPVLGDLDVQVEVDALAEQLLDAFAGIGPDLAQS